MENNYGLIYDYHVLNEISPLKLIFLLSSCKKSQKRKIIARSETLVSNIENVRKYNKRFLKYIKFRFEQQRLLREVYKIMNVNDKT